MMRETREVDVDPFQLNPTTLAVIALSPRLRPVAHITMSSTTTLIEFTKFTLSVASSSLFEDATAHVIEGQRIALVGANGSGKSTLLRALARRDDSGSYFDVGAGRVSGYLAHKERSATSVLLVEQDALRWRELFPAAVGFGEDELREMTMGEALDTAAASGDEEALEDAESFRQMCVAAHDVLGWRTAGYESTPLGQLSPGCAVRAYLSVALCRQSVRLLLLDEPTNHLDLPGILWLQEMIVASGKAVAVVSHDGDFLDAVATHLWEIDPLAKSLTVVGLSYSKYQHAKQLAIEQQKAAYAAQQKRHERLTTAAERLRSASTAGSRHKASDHDLLQRDFKRDRAGRSGRHAKALLTLRDSESKVERVVERKPLRIVVDYVGSGVDAAVLVGDVILGHPAEGGGEAEPLPLPPITLRIDFGEHVAIVGFNGVGKTTLLRTLIGDLEPMGGEVRVGRDLRIGNLRQEHESLPRDQTMREHFAKRMGMDPFTIGQRLMGYGLNLHQVDSRMGELNPGARARALLASFSMHKVNTLVLDEPTNHLDEEAVAEVLAALNSFSGTLIVVSHSRTFLRALRLSRTLQLTSAGLKEIESVDAFVDLTVEEVKAVVGKVWC